MRAQFYALLPAMALRVPDGAGRNIDKETKRPRHIYCSYWQCQISASGFSDEGDGGEAGKEKACGRICCGPRRPLRTSQNQMTMNRTCSSTIDRVIEPREEQHWRYVGMTERE
jgi:hypothetical protein